MYGQNIHTSVPAHGSEPLNLSSRVFLRLKSRQDTFPPLQQGVSLLQRTLPSFPTIETAETTYAIALS